MEKAARNALVGLAVATALTSCGAGPALESTVGVRPVLLQVDYRDGGPGPIGFLLSIFEDGAVRFYSPRWRPYWSRLSAADLAEAHRFVASGSLDALNKELTTLYPHYSFACCDFRELGIVLGQQYSLGIPIHDDHPVPNEATNFIDFINRLGRYYFGHRYSLPVPVPPTIDASSPPETGRLTPRCSGQHPGVRPVVAAELIRR